MNHCSKKLPCFGSYRKYFSLHLRDPHPTLQAGSAVAAQFIPTHQSLIQGSQNAPGRMLDEVDAALKRTCGHFGGYRDAGTLLCGDALNFSRQLSPSPNLPLSQSPPLPISRNFSSPEVAALASQIDGPTETEIIVAERVAGLVQWVGDWKSALGQILIYSTFYPEHRSAADRRLRRRRLHLFDSAKEKGQIAGIAAPCLPFNVLVTFEVLVEVAQ